jgi:CRISPR-associated endonuclease/helicase Cas3
MTPDDFPAFFEAVHGHLPFPWQARLACQVAQDGWPAVLAVPTASGKSSAIDVAVFTLALQAGRRLAERSVPLRVFLVIDRRIVVDQAAKHANQLRKKLESSSSPLVAEVARRLREFGGPGPLHVSALRGGMYRDETWARAPNQPTVCVSTVDQVGSRLLFRGYGLSEYRRPVHAGLAGHDALYLIDEAHLSEPFLETLSAVGRYRVLAESPVPGPFVVVEMSATPHSDGDRFCLGPDDRENQVLRARLAAPKPALLVSDPARFEAEAAARAREALGRQGTFVVGVVVNRVASARQIFEELRDQRGAEAVLLTGRVRPWDRQRLLDKYLDRVQAGRVRGPDIPPLFVVATQTVEVGADLDFDFLVTEAAPLPALRQRFGRLDRLGQFGQGAGVILHRRAKDTDPIYADELKETWKWLKGQVGKGEEAVIDFGIDALNSLLERSPSPPKPEARHAPVMLPAHLDTWGQTCPTPRPDPDVSPFLHGADALEAADVTVVWRADLAWENSNDHDKVERDWVDTVRVSRPVVLEGLPVAAGSARAWLKGLAAVEMADLEGCAPASEEGRGRSHRPVLRWRGPDDSVLVGPDDIRPGDTLVVPSAYGGADCFGWAPGLRNPVMDIGDPCFNWMADATPDSGRPQPIRLRLHTALYHQLLTASVISDDVARPEVFEKHLVAACRAIEDDGEWRDDVRWLLNAFGEVIGGNRLMAATIARFQDSLERLKPVPYPRGLVLTLRVQPGFSGAPAPLPPEAADAGEPTAEDDAASLVCQPMTLEEHTAGVASRVREFARGCGLDDRLVLVLERAAQLHDLGKADHRFQAMLYGDEVAAAAGGILAKSGMDREDQRAFREAWRLSRLPKGFRHEFVSVALIRGHQEALLRDLAVKERELVEYLVGTHHGRGRAFAPVVSERDPEPVALEWEGTRLSTSPDHRLWRLGSGWTDLFWRLVRRYGYWGLAYLEAVLVLADQARSRDEERGRC